MENLHWFSTVQYDSLVVHSNSKIHQVLEINLIYGIQRKEKPITEHITCIDDRNEDKVIKTMKFVYWVMQEDLSLSKYESVCLFAMSL